MRLLTLFFAVSLLMGFATWAFSADTSPHNDQTPTGILDDPCETDTPSLPRHTVVADINYTDKTVSVEQRILYQNTTNSILSDIVLNIESNRWANTFFLKELRIDDDVVASYTLTEKRLTIPLFTPLNKNCRISLLLKFDLHVPQIGGGLITDSKGYLGYTERQMNLAHWLATVAVYHMGQWITQPAFYIGEQEVVAPADWLVTLNLINPPPTLTIAAAGVETNTTPTSKRYEHLNSREFSLSLSHQFNVAYEFLPSGKQIELYTFTDLVSQGNRPVLPEEIVIHALRSATQSFNMFNDLFGTYPYERLLVVQGDFPDGMELSGMVFVGDRWFTRYTGDPRGYLMLITVHEVAHQWWYAQVGNNAALNPWLDEALATYSEYIFIEEYYPDLREWWWEFRVNQYAPEGFVDSTVYDFPNVRAYINAVYLRGVRMLHEIRVKIGKEAFFTLLANYAKAEKGEIAYPQDFWALMSSDQLEQTRDIRKNYLRIP